jgi:5-methylcytosine-specific restriction endonuclease McrA
MSSVPHLTPLFIVLGILAGIKIVLDQWVFDKKRERRRNFYRDIYLASDDWKRKRALVLKRDSYRCVFCGGHATQVHHKKYARRNIGREPIEWLVSVCKACHDKQHEGS